MALTTLEEEFRSVAGISIIVPIIIMMAAAEGSRPSMVHVRISPVAPPLATAPMTIDETIAMPITVNAAPGEAIPPLPKRRIRKAAFMTPPITEPSL